MLQRERLVAAAAAATAVSDVAVALQSSPFFAPLPSKLETIDTTASRIAAKAVSQLGCAR